MPERRQYPDDNPFRVNSPRKILSRARERWQLVRHWLIRHDDHEPDVARSEADQKDPAGRRK